ncbi:MAG: hypothetical protein IPK99_01570 [Flavobacteriales bacterium]|nr:hypothetical protein [Flavobacteriales bacterium]
MESLENSRLVAAVERVCSEFTGTLKKQSMDKFTVRLGISNLSSPALLQKGRTVSEMLTGNPDYPTLQALLAAFNALCDTLEAANNEVLFNGGKVSHEAKRVAEAALRSALKDFGGYVQGISGGTRA